VLREELVLLDSQLGGAARLDDDVVLVVDDLLQVLRLQTQEVPDLVRERLEIPDVDHRHAERNVAHTLAPHLLLRDLDAATVADDAFIANALVLAAMALPVL